MFIKINTYSMLERNAIRVVEWKIELRVAFSSSSTKFLDLHFSLYCINYLSFNKINSKKIPTYSSHCDLSIELFNVKFRALWGPKLRFSWLFACSSRVFPRFLHFKNRFWRRVWRKNSGKNSNCSSHWDLSIELFNVEFLAYEGLEWRFLWHFCTLKSRFSNFKRRFWRRI